ncbi:OmpA family protein [Spirillospora sp. NPDC050679]
MGFAVGAGRRATAVAALPLLIAPAACSGDRSEQAGEERPRAGAGTGASAPRKVSGDALGVRGSFWHSQVTVELLSLQRMAGKAVTARFRVVNGTSKPYPIESSLTGDGTRNQTRPKSVDPSAVSALSLVDGRNAKVHFPLNRSDGRCLCTRYHPFPSAVAAGASWDLTAVFPAPPKDVRHVNVLFPHAPPFLDVPLTETGAGPVTFDPKEKAVDPVTADTAPPLVLPVTGAVETGPDAEDDQGAELSVRLSTDVLFAVDKADLSAAARQSLARVAARIEESSGPTVRIDGHTDTTGGDAVNGPLSERRARAVQDALSSLVKRKGVAFRSKGHGSSEPVASNDHDAGRAKNRRVTVTFARPADRGPATPVPAAHLKEPWPRPVLARAPLATRPAGSGPAPWPDRGHAEINDLRRDSSGYVTLVWTAVNSDPDTALDTGFLSDLNGEFQGSSTSGVVLAAGDRRARALRDSTGRTVGAPDFNSYGPSNRFKVEGGDDQPFWAMFKVPADVKAVTVEIPGYRSMPNVPIG